MGQKKNQCYHFNQGGKMPPKRRSQNLYRLKAVAKKRGETKRYRALDRAIKKTEAKKKK